MGSLQNDKKNNNKRETEEEMNRILAVFLKKIERRKEIASFPLMSIARTLGRIKSSDVECTTKIHANALFAYLYCLD